MPHAHRKQRNNDGRQNSRLRVRAGLRETTGILVAFRTEMLKIFPVMHAAIHRFKTQRLVSKLRLAVICPGI